MARSEGDRGYWHALFGYFQGVQSHDDGSASASEEEEVYELNEEVVSERQQRKNKVRLQTRIIAVGVAVWLMLFEAIPQLNRLFTDPSAIIRETGMTNVAVGDMGNWGRVDL